MMSNSRVDLPATDMMTFSQIKQLLGLDQALQLRERLQQDQPGR